MVTYNLSVIVKCCLTVIRNSVFQTKLIIHVHLHTVRYDIIIAQWKLEGQFKKNNDNIIVL